MPSNGGSADSAGGDRGDGGNSSGGNTGGGGNNGNRGGADTGRGSNPDGSTNTTGTGRGAGGIGASGYGSDSNSAGGNNYSGIFSGVNVGGFSSFDPGSDYNGIFDGVDLGGFSAVDENGNFTGVIGNAETSSKVQTISKNILAKFVDTLTVSNPITGLANIGTKLYSGKTIGDHIAQAVANATLSGLSDIDAAAAGASAAAAAIRSEGGENGNDADSVAMAETFSNIATAATNEANTTNNDLADIPSSIQTGLDQYVTDSQAATDAYKVKADALWNDYLDFEKTYFDKNELTLDTYNKDIASIPGLNLKMPNSMGGATVAMAPKVHSAMYGDQASTRSNIINQQANTALAGLTNRTGIAQNQYGVDSTQASNAMIPTQTALDLYKMERAGELGINQVEAGKADSPSAWTTWAPVVGGLLATDDSGDSALDSLISTVGGLF